MQGQAYMHLQSLLFVAVLVSGLLHSGTAHQQRLQITEGSLEHAGWGEPGEAWLDVEPDGPGRPQSWRVSMRDKVSFCCCVTC